MKNKAFTLIELLVVIAIISLLSSVVLASVNTSRIKSRDARRFEDLVQIRTALTMYFLDNGGVPSCSSNPCSGSSLTTALAPTLTVTSNTNGRWWNTVSLIKKAEAGSVYISKLPSDPVNTGGIIYYYSTGPTVQSGYIDKNGRTVNLSNQGVFFVVSESKTQNISNPYTIVVTVGEPDSINGYGASVKEILGRGVVPNNNVVVGGGEGDTGGDSGSGSGGDSGGGSGDSGSGSYSY